MLQVTMQVMREDGSTAGPGENGEIMVHGDTLFKGEPACLVLQSTLSCLPMHPSCVLA